MTDGASVERRYEERIANLIESYQMKVEDFALETRRVSAALEACRQRGIKAPRNVYGEAGLGWDAAMEYVEAAIQRVSRSARGTGGEDAV
jgi:hypothetical protein